MEEKSKKRGSIMINIDNFNEHQLNISDVNDNNVIDK